MSGGAERQRNWLVPAIAGALLLALTLIALLREPVQLDTSTPEGTVQQFLQAIADEDYEAAHSFLSTRLRADCTEADIALGGPYDSFTATLGDVEEINGEALVRVTLRIGTEGGLDSGGYGFDPGPYQVVQESGAWAIDDVTWPYFMYECGI